MGDGSLCDSKSVLSAQMTLLACCRCERAESNFSTQIQDRSRCLSSGRLVIVDLIQAMLHRIELVFGCEMLYLNFTLYSYDTVK